MSTSSRRNFLKSASLLGGGLFLGSGVLSNCVYASAPNPGLPYYKPGAPFLNDLRRGKGEPFSLQGIVYRHDGITPLADATVEIWHCDENGHFDFSNRFLYRAKTQTDRQGRYRIKTEFPGKYKENGYTKMSRIFILVSGAGHASSFSQLYFDFNRNPFIDHQHWAACPMAQRPSLPKLSRLKSQTIVTCHHYLTSAAFFHIPRAKEYAASRLKLYPGFQNQPTLAFGNVMPGHVAVRVINKKGEIVQKQFFNNVQSEQQLVVAGNLPAGVYTCSIYTSRYGYFIKRLSVG